LGGDPGLRDVDDAATLRRMRALDHVKWMVWVEGGEPVGPVSADQIARGIRAQRVPTDASVQRMGDVFWSEILDEPEVIEALKSL
jgi:hypothetical protein